MDELKGKRPNRYGIINLDVLSGGGTHWVCYYMLGPNNAVYFDSFGLAPDKRIVDYLVANRGKYHILYSTAQIQNLASRACGYYCIYVIRELDKGRDFLDILLDFEPKDTVANEHQIRKII